MSRLLGRSRSAVNTVQPTGHFPLSKPPLSANRHGELSTEDLIEASTQLPARLEKLHQDNERLKQQVDSLKRSLENKESVLQKNRELSMQMDNLRKRHAAMAERRVNMNQGRTENTLSANRQSDIEREYREEFRDGQRLDAVDTIDTNLKKGHKTKTRELSMDEKLKAYRLACVIFEAAAILDFIFSTKLCRDIKTYRKISYECASNAKESFLGFYSSLVETLVTDAPSIALSDDKYRKLSDSKFPKKSRATKDSLSEIMVFVKEEAGKHNLEKLVKEVKKELKKRWKETGKTAQVLPTFDKSLKKDLKEYIGYCTRFSWRIVTQVPPLKIDYKSPTFNPFYHNESQAFAAPQRGMSRQWVDSREREEIKCYVWPTLSDFDNRVIQKGDVVLKEPKFHDHVSSV